jgi:hypothetical protein
MSTSLIEVASNLENPFQIRLYDSRNYDIAEDNTMSTEFVSSSIDGVSERSFFGLMYYSLLDQNS